LGTAPGPPRNPNSSCIAELNGSKSVDKDAGRGPGAKRGSERRKEGGAESDEWWFALERLPPRPRGGAAAAVVGSRVSAAGTDGSARARASSAGMSASSKCAAVVFELRDGSELRWDGGALLFAV
jgi:hypothetical protein